MFYNLEELKFLEDNKDKTFLIFAYGRLKSNHPIHSMLLSDSIVKYLGEKTTKDKYILYDLKEYPILSDLDEGEASVRGELYMINGETLLHIDKYMYLYDRRMIELSDGSLAETYMMTVRLKDKKISPDVDNLLTWKG